MNCIRICGLAAAMVFAVTQAHAQILFSDDFDDGAAAARWTAPIDSQESAPADWTVDYAFDYSAVINAKGPNIGLPIPSAPNSVGGSTTGIYMTANNTDQCPGLACDPIDDVNEGESVGIVSLFDLPAGQNYKVTADVYSFWNGNGGSTEYAAFGVNHDRSDAVPFRFGLDDGSGLAWQADTDGDSGTDIIKFDSSSGQTGLGGWEDIPDGTVPGVSTGAAGEIGLFTGGWVEFEITVANGVSRFSINGAEIDTNSNPFSGGGVLLSHADPFNSVNDACIACGGFTNGTIWDNVVVMVIPEPSTVMLGCLGLAALGLRRRV